MREVVYICPCGGRISLAFSKNLLTCGSCDAIFKEAPPLLMVKRGRDDSVQEGTLARVLTEASPDEQRPQRVAETTR